MSRTRQWTRPVGLSVLAALVMLLSGDRGARTDIYHGQDPLEILNLQIRANAIIVLDSSGSMQENLAAFGMSGDDVHSKMYQAKSTVAKVIKDNERKVSFKFGQYTQPGAGSGTPMTLPTTGTERFLYTTDMTAARAPSMATNEMSFDLRSYYVPAGATMRFRENTTNRTFVVTATNRRFNTGVELANALSLGMSSGSTNTYTVTYGDDHRFTFTRTGTTNFTLRWSQMTSTADAALRTVMNAGTADQGSGGGPFTTGVGAGDIELRRRRNADMRSTVTEDVAVGAVTMYKAYARRFFNGTRIVVRQPSATSAADGNIVCSVTPNLGTIGAPGPWPNGFGDGQLDNPADPLSFRRQPWIDVVRGDANCAPMTGASAQTARFFFGSVPRGLSPNGYDNTYIPGYGEWRDWQSAQTCGGFQGLVDLTPCTNNAQFGLFSPYLEPEIPVNQNTGWPIGYVEDGQGGITTQPTVGGIRAGGNTPIAETIQDVDAEWEGTLWPTISAYGGGSGPFPKTFLIFLTDGDDTCESPTGGNSLSDEQRALRAAYRAERLFTSVDPTPGARRVASSVTTFLVAFGQGVSADKADWIAWGGSGMTRTTTGTGSAQRWQDWPGSTAAARAAAALAYKEANCPNCQDALLAANAAELSRLLQIAIDQGQQVGTFSDQQSVTDSVFELSYVVGYDPRNPQTRYRASVPVLLQSTFVMPDFQGHLIAFRRNAAATIAEWDAAVKLKNRILNGTNGTNGMGTPLRTYAELRGSYTNVNPVTNGARIKRRIYSSARNGVFSPTIANLLAGQGAANSRVQLWPADAVIDPDPGATLSVWTVGAFDDEMGLTALTFNDLRTLYGACTSAVAADLPADCTAATNRALGEARQIVLAWMAGAELVKSGAAAVRQTGAGKPIQFRPRVSPMVESTLAAPAVVGPPPPELPGSHTDEYRLFTTGARNAGAGGAAVNGVLSGFGLRDPDKDSTVDANDGRQDLKPVMNVVYHAANDMLHAFRAGACRDVSGNPVCRDTVTETGGEELWGFVPFDLLGKLRLLALPQSRDTHVYMLAAPVRFGQVFVPGTWTSNIGGVSVGGAGVWRNVMLVGRGIGGKYMTGLDVTAPGPFTEGSLSTQGPIVLWNRGNPDTQTGLVGGPANNPLSGTDGTAYAEMGETWSTPAMARVEPRNNVTIRKPTGIEFVAYMGSGYSSLPAEGKRFYVFDPLTGDIIASTNIGNRAAGMPFENSIPSGPVAFNPLTLTARVTAVNPGEVVTTKVYFNDLHGRVYRVNTDAPTSTSLLIDLNGSNTTVLQPFGVSPSLLNYADSAGILYPHVFVESGRESRIFPPDASPATTPPFKAFSIADKAPAAAVVNYAKDFPFLFRGTTQPATAFTVNGLGRVLFGGTRFNPQGSSNAPPPPPCRSSFDSILFALTAQTGNAAFDLNATGQDEYITYVDDIIHSVQIVEGQVVVDHGLKADIAPTPPPSSVIAPPTDSSVFPGLSVPSRYSVSNRDSAYKVGSGVCR